MKNGVQRPQRDATCRHSVAYWTAEWKAWYKWSMIDKRPLRVTDRYLSRGQHMPADIVIYLEVAAVIRARPPEAWMLNLLLDNHSRVDMPCFQHGVTNLPQLVDATFQVDPPLPPTTLTKTKGYLDAMQFPSVLPSLPCRRL